MREPIEHNNEAVKVSARARLQKLGIAEDLLNTEGLDFDLLYQRLRYELNKPHFYRRILITEKWQFRALSGLDVMSEEMNPHQLQDDYGATPIHYAAWSGRLEVVNWLLTHNLEWMSISDDRGLTPVHYAAWSGNPQVLDWVKMHAPQALLHQDYKGYSVIHSTALSGNPDMLDWVKTHAPYTLGHKDLWGSTPIHCSPLSGNPVIIDWIKTHAPETLELKNRERRTPIHSAALSGNATSLNQALMLQKNPESWSLDIELRPVQSQVLIKTLIDALETNYTLTSIQGLDAFPMSSEEKALIHSHLIRNRLIKDAKLRSIVFTQGFTQMESAASCLPMELHRQIFEHMLPSNLDVDRFFREVKQTLNLNQRRQVRKEHALTLIDREIARLSLSNAEHNKLLSISLDKLYTNSDEKIKALLELKTVVTQETTHIDQAISAWELTYAPNLSVHRSIACRFFTQGPTRSQCFIQSLKETLGIDTKNNSGVEAEADNLTP